MSLVHHAIAVGIYALSSTCQYFSNVVIPPTDTTPPTPWTGIYSLESESYVALAGNDVGAEYEIGADELTNTYLLVAAGIDDGGVAQVEMTPTLLVYCGLSGPPIITQLTPEVVTQSGNIGDTVSDGQWTYFPVRFDSFVNAQFQSPSCGGAVTAFLEVVWSTTVIDFHGNRADGGVSGLQFLRQPNVANPDPSVSKPHAERTDETSLLLRPPAQ